MLDEKAYELIRSWRRGEINGNQFDYRLQLLGVTEAYCRSVTKEKDAECIRAVVKEAAVLAFGTMLFVSFIFKSGDLRLVEKRENQRYIMNIIRI